jgi:ribonuclease HI
MKTLKLDHHLAKSVLKGDKTSTWRINDDKDISVNDDIELIDKVDPLQPSTWRVIGLAHVNEVIAKRLADITESDFENSHEYMSTEDLVHSYRRYYGEGVNERTPVKIIKFSFKPYETPVEPVDQVLSQKQVKMFADGGSRGNPGPSASGYAILDMNDNVIKKSGIYLGITTNNQAEYRALKFGLEEAQKMGAQEVEVYMDSLLVVNQMKGIFKVKNRDLWPIHEAIKEQAKIFKKVTYTHVPRELNKLADAEVNETLDAEAQR